MFKTRFDKAKKAQLFISVLTCFFTLSLNAQTSEVFGEISTSDSTIIKVIQVSPDSFPAVSVVFEAVKNGTPVFGIQKEDVIVTEIGVSSDVIQLNEVSQNYPIYITLVIDHSGSMNEDYSQLYDFEN